MAVDTLLLIIASALVAPVVAARAHARYQQRHADTARARAEKDAMAREAEQALLTLLPRAFSAPGSAAEVHNEFEELAAPRAEAVGNADVSDRIGRLRLLVRHAATLGAGQHWQFAVGTAIEDARYGLLAYLHDEQPRRVRVRTRDEVGVWAAQGPDVLWSELAQHLAYLRLASRGPHWPDDLVSAGVSEPGRPARARNAERGRAPSTHRGRRD